MSQNSIANLTCTPVPGRSGGGVGFAITNPSVPERTIAIVEGLSLLVRLHGARSEIVHNMSKQITDYLNKASDEMVWVKLCKYLLCLPLAQYLKTEKPLEPEIPFAFTGMFLRWYRNRIKLFSRRNTHLWYSWFQAKRCALVSSDQFMEKTYADHFTSLTREDPGDEFAIDAAFAHPTFFRVLTSIRHTLPKRETVTWIKSLPSASACFEATRAQGGQWLSLRRRLLVDEERVDSFVSYTSELSQMVEAWSIPSRESQVISLYIPSGRDDWEDLLHEKWDFSQPLRATIQGIIEPLKVRVISKGECLPYYSMIWLQKALHGTMRKMDCFRLIGRPFSPTDLKDLTVHSKAWYHWFSVDYSAATDGLSWKFSSRILRVLLADDEKLLEEALRVLGPHRLFYPVRDVTGSVYTEERGIQSNGQLMGSILSFPILCLANLATYLLTMNKEHYGLSDEKRLKGVLVNGDDMVYAAPPHLWERHKEVSADLGLTMSVGKAYSHPIYANINSTSIHLDLSREGACPRQIDYLNLGLHFGTDVQKKKEKKTEGVGVSPNSGPASCINVLQQGCLTIKDRHAILKDYFSRHRDELSAACRASLLIETKQGVKRKQVIRNLFLPCSSGGMGVEAPPGWRYRIKKIDQYIARSLRPEGIDFSANPLPGYEPEEVRIEKTPWSKPFVEPEPEFYIPQGCRPMSRVECQIPVRPWIRSKRICVSV